MRRYWMSLLAAVMMAAFVGATGKAAENDSPGKVILNTKSFWRFRVVWETEDVLLDSGKVDYVRFVFKDRHALRDKKEVKEYTVERVPVIRLPAETSSGWVKPTFDDSTWVRSRGAILEKSAPVMSNNQNVNWKLILMRGRFEVTDPARAGELALSMKFKGGVVVYLNGEELTRAFMPGGEVDLYTPAEPYPRELFVRPDGYLLWNSDAKLYPDLFEQRIRQLSGFKIPTSRLKKGVNVLAIAIHRAPSDQVLFLRRVTRYPHTQHGHYTIPWCRVALTEVKLEASGGGILSGSATVEAEKLLAWNQSVLRRVYTSDYPDPFEPLQPVRIAGVRNGSFAAQIVVGSHKPIRGLEARLSSLAGPATIPASAVQIRYALPDGEVDARYDFGVPFDSLEEVPPAEVPVYEQSGSAIQPIWVNVSVPGDASPGDYKGMLTISADGLKPLKVPLELKVIDWTLPECTRLTPFMDIIESPESVAIKYGVPLWSDEHFQLLERTFALLRPLAVKTLYITCVRRTHWGNEDAMVRWVRGADGQLQPDFTIVNRYLDVATKYLGKVPAVILYAWEPLRSMGHAHAGAGSTYDRPILISVLDPKTGKLRRAKGPAWGTPECQAFWTKLAKGIEGALEKRGMKDSLRFGLVGDTRPTKQAMHDISVGAPSTKWAIHSHYYCDNWQGYQMGMCSAVWGIHCRTKDPSTSHGYGWRNPFPSLYFPREMSPRSPLVEYRTKVENWLGAECDSNRAGVRGLGRLGADFWKVFKDRHEAPRGTLAGRYPETAWGQLNLNNGIPSLLGVGKYGAVPTVRSEGFRGSIQEVEARVFIEKALLDETKKARLGQDLAQRCRVALDERIRMCMHAAGEGWVWFASSGWQERGETLFRLAAEVQRKLGG